jgi:hypothetical protein
LTTKSVPRYARNIQRVSIAGLPLIVGAATTVTVMGHGSPLITQTYATLVGLCVIGIFLPSLVTKVEEERAVRAAVAGRVRHGGTVYNTNPHRPLQGRQQVLPCDTWEPTEEMTAKIQRPAPAIGPDPRREPPFAALKENTGGWPEVT